MRTFNLTAATIALAVAAAQPAGAQQAKFDPQQCDGRTAQECNDLMGSLDVPPDRREQVLLVRATSLLQKHDLPAAVAEYREMTVIDPHSLMAFSTLGFLESIGENWKDAAADLKRAVEIDPGQDGIRAMLVMALAKGGDCPGAKATLADAKTKVKDESALATAGQTVGSTCP